MGIRTSQNFDVNAQFPIDSRLTSPSMATALNMPFYQRYKGLKIFIIDIQQEYWFRDGTDNTDFIPYKPENFMIVTSIAERDSIPLQLRREGMIVNVTMGGNYTKYMLLGGIWKVMDSGVLNWSVI
jgi:hypothetical protein